jgi:hypothetical protein
MFVAAVGAAVFLGFLSGLFLFKLKARWCRRCGATLQCLDCLQRLRALPPS